MVTLFTNTQVPETDDGPERRAHFFIVAIKAETQPLDGALAFAKPIGSLASPANAKRPVKQRIGLGNKCDIILVEWFYAVGIGKHRPVSVLNEELYSVGFTPGFLAGRRLH